MLKKYAFVDVFYKPEIVRKINRLVHSTHKRVLVIFSFPLRCGTPLVMVQKSYKKNVEKTTGYIGNKRRKMLSIIKCLYVHLAVKTELILYGHISRKSK